MPTDDSYSITLWWQMSLLYEPLYIPYYNINDNIYKITNFLI